ncbi:hydroxypyruvate isomerase family protein [Erythrobacter sp. W53]|uniref:hydroxypyruvate isomerase family protein n=1 Tax=Erythrobacter sp. W53 TaxID=3425947 RepID=UPI003D76A331
MIDRREVLIGATALGGASMVSETRGLASRKGSSTPAKFRLGFAPHDGMFRHSAGESIIDQIKFAADQGFTAWEDNGLAGRPVALQEQIGSSLARHGMQMGVYVAGMPDSFWQNQPVFCGADPKNREDFLALIAKQAEVAKRVNAKWTTVVPGFADPRLPYGFQEANIIELLKRASDIYEESGLTLVLEPLNTKTDHPGVFLTHVAQAYAICTAVDRPECKILFDIYHEQIEKGNLIDTIDYAWDHTVYYQIADNPKRKEPGTGEINYANVLGHLDARGYDGIIGMEHGNSIEGKAGEDAVISAYRRIEREFKT